MIQNLQPGLKALFKLTLLTSEGEQIYVKECIIKQYQKTLDRCKIRLEPKTDFAFELHCNTSHLYPYDENKLK